MEHTKLSRLLMIAGGIAIAGIVIAFAIILPPSILWLLPVKHNDPLYWGVLFSLWLIALLYLMTMGKYMVVCRRIGKNRSFCAENVQALKGISRLLWISAALWILPPVLCDLAGGSGALIWGAALLSMASLAMGLLAYALSRLLQHAVQLQEESDLTI